MSDQLCKISINNIDLNDLRYKIVFNEPDLTHLAQSILATGLIYPPVLRSLKNNTFCIVHGFNRVHAMLLNQRSHINCQVLDSNLSEADYIYKAISSRSFKQELTQVELARSLILLKPHHDIAEISNLSSSLFNKKISEKYIKQILKICEISSDILELIEAKHLSFKAAQKISNLPVAYHLPLIELFSHLRASNSIQLEMITNLFEISKRDKIEIIKVIQACCIDQIINDRSLDTPAKTIKVRQAVYQNRYPTLFNNQQEIKNLISELPTKTDVLFSPSENFDDTQIRVSFNVKTIKDLESKINTLNKCLNHPSIQKIL